jgi:hypothetical protein
MFYYAPKDEKFDGGLAALLLYEQNSKKWKRKFFLFPVIYLWGTY